MASIENSLKYESEVEPGKIRLSLGAAAGGARRPAEPGRASPLGEPQTVVGSGSPGRLAPPVACPTAELQVRRKLLHGPPLFPVTGPIVQFITINAVERGGEPFLPVAAQMLDSARFYHEYGRWFLGLFLIMPDHLHFLASFPSGRVKEICGAWKGYLRRTMGVRFQSDCFEHRIRNAAEFAEKWNYICQNPVRKGLVTSADEWPYWMAFSSQSGIQVGGAPGGTRRPAEPGRGAARRDGSPHRWLAPSEKVAESKMSGGTR